jgi:hypothetical protein
MTMTRGSGRGKHGLSVLLWALAIMLWGASEALLLYAKAHKSIHALWSMWTWYLPLMLILPSLTAIDTYFRFARTVSGAGKDTASQMWSNLLAVLLCVTNGTILVCIAILLTGNY